jgi:hypothetical protein
MTQPAADRLSAPETRNLMVPAAFAVLWLLMSRRPVVAA